MAAQVTGGAGGGLGDGETRSLEAGRGEEDGDGEKTDGWTPKALGNPIGFLTQKFGSVSRNAESIRDGLGDEGRMGSVGPLVGCFL